MKTDPISAAVGYRQALQRALQAKTHHAALLPMLSPDNHPGAALLAELAAARELAGLVRTYEGLPIEVRTALAAYDRAVKGRSDGNL